MTPKRATNELDEPLELIANMMSENINDYSRMSDEIGGIIINGSGKNLPVLLRAIEMDRLARTLGQDFVYGVPEGPARDYALRVKAAYEAQNQATAQKLLDECEAEKKMPNIPNHFGSCDRCRIVKGKWTYSTCTEGYRGGNVLVELCEDCRKLAPKNQLKFAMWVINEIFDLNMTAEECQEQLKTHGLSLWEKRALKLRAESKEDPEIPEPPVSEEVKKFREGFLQQARAMRQMALIEKGLTHRQAEVMVLMEERMTPSQIGKELGIKTQTVNTMIRRIGEKLNPGQ